MFLETPRFPGCPSFGFVSEPVYVVAVVERASGIESRTRSWARPLSRYSVVVGPRAQDEVQEVLEFYHAVGGRAYGFRFKDGTDYLSCRVGQTPASTDQPILLDTELSPDGYQLVKKYVAGALTQYREVYKPVEGTISVTDNGALKTETTDYTIDYGTGLVTLNFSPVGPLTWGGEFDVPVRFDSELPVEILNSQIQSASFALRELRREDDW